MSVKQMGVVWDLDLPPNQRLVLLAYADHADDEGGSIFPSLARVAHKTGYSRDQVRRISKELVAANLMVRVSEATPGRGAEYRLTLERGSILPPFKPRGGGANNPSQVGAPMPPEPSVEPSVITSKETNVSLSGDGHGSAEGKAEAAPMEMGAYGISELMQRVNAARQRGAEIHSPTDAERRDFGRQFKQCDKDGRDTDTLLLALDYMVARAAGEIENERKAWCGFRTALDRVLEGWRPKRALRAVRDPEHERMVAENERLEAEIIASATASAL